MKEKTLKNLSFLYIILPIIIFVVGWIKPIISIPIAVLLVLAYLKIFFNNKEDKEIFIEKKHIFFILGFCIIFCITAGLGNLFYQSDDWDTRNAIYRDIVNKNWPVTYENTYMLVYYIGFWMVPSLAGKIVNLVVDIINNCASTTIVAGEVAFGVSNIAMLFWGAFGVLLTLLWLIKLLNLKESKKYWKAIAIFLLFSGLDFLGVLVKFKLNVFLDKHLEWWAEPFQYSSIVTQIFWVFNQAIPIWLIMLMFLSEEKVDNYCVIIIAALAYTPFGAVGLIPLFICKGIVILIKSIKEKNLKCFIKDIFSFQNIVFLIAILPMYYFYYFGNASVLGGSGQSNSFIYTIFDEYTSSKQYYTTIKLLIIFYLLEVGLYIIFLFKDHKKDALYYTVAISLIFIPIFKIGYASDFCMRASIPALVLVDFWVVKFLLDNKNLLSFGFISVIVIFIIGCVTPGTEYYRAISSIVENKKINLVYDESKTVVSDEKVYSTNFVAENYKENSKFYKYYAKNDD